MNNEISHSKYEQREFQHEKGLQVTIFMQSISIILDIPTEMETLFQDIVNFRLLTDQVRNSYVFPKL